MGFGYQYLRIFLGELLYISVVALGTLHWEEKAPGKGLWD